MPRFSWILGLFLASALAGASPGAKTIAWRVSTNVPEPTDGHAAGLIDGKLLLVGGTYWEGSKGHWTKKVFSATSLAFDPVSERWEKLADAPVTFAYAAYTQVGQELFVLGGLQNGVASRDVRTLRKMGGDYVWRRLGELPETRLFANAVAVGPVIYVIGGTKKFEPLDNMGTCCTSETAAGTLWALDTAHLAAGWKTLASFPGPQRWHHSAVTDGRAIYLFGGMYQAHKDDPVAKFYDVWRYDLATDTWSRLADLPEAMLGAAVVRAGERIILVGKAGRVMAFDPPTGRFSRLDDIPRDVSVNYFGWTGSALVGASGETPQAVRRRRSEWTFIGKLQEGPGRPAPAP